MPGLYLLPTRAPGTLITALIYNGDHQQDADGRAAQFMQSFGVSLDQMNVEQSPFAADGTTEVLPTAVSNELAVIRFVISSIKAFFSGTAPTPNWWQPVSAPAFSAVGARVCRPTTQSIANNTLTAIDFTGGTADFNSGVWEGVTHPTRFTAPTAGLYYAAASIQWGVAGGAGVRQVQLRVNGTTANATKTNTNVLDTEQFQTVSGLLKLAANDYVEFMVLQTSGFSLNLVADTSALAYPAGALIFFGVTS